MRYKLRSAVWEITLACCFSCKYCGSSGGRARNNELTTVECLKVAEQLADLGCQRVSLIGGEVFMRQDWFEIVKGLTDRGIRTCIITNGFLFRPELIEALKRANIESVAVSLDGPRTVHDKYRQTGSFDRALAAIDTLTQNQIPVSVISTLNAENVKYLEEFYKILKDKGIFAWQLQACSPMGNAANAGIDYAFDFERVLDFVSRHLETAPFSIGVADNIGYFSPGEEKLRGSKKRKFAFEGCAAGLESIGIDSIGNVRGCESMYDESFIEGNLREKSLKEIWENPDNFAYNRKFTPEALTGACAECDFAGKCAGGCRSYNYFVHHKLYESPACVNAKKIKLRRKEMGVSRRVLKYAEQNFHEVLHTTLNPEGPGVVRIHMIPPQPEGKTLGMSVAIINGQDIIPVNTSWSVVLAEFIKSVNEYHGQSINEEQTNEILEKTAKNVKKVFPFISKKRIKGDIFVIMNTFKQVAYREEVTEKIGYMTMGEYAPYMRAPHRMDLMVSAMTKDGHWHCNQKCVHCYAAGQTQAEEEELSTEDWKEIIDRCRAACIPQVTFTGGEPTMREDLIDLIDYAKWFVTRLNTNGIKLTKEYCRLIKAASLDSLQITFYSDKEDIHNKLVGAPHYSDTVAGIENALAAGLSVSINTPLCVLNKDYRSTLEFLHEKGVQYVTCSGLITTGNATKLASEELQLSSEEIKQVLKDAVEYCFANDMEISFTSPGWVEDEYCEELGINPPSCGACLSNMAITPGGNVVPCQSWLSGKVLGNMLTDSWANIWNSEECSKRRAYSAQMLGKCPLRREHEKA